jgi:basic membrane lipoprotein Med (substrate-binding protein (PBP1-ABC) superfamily)
MHQNALGTFKQKDLVNYSKCGYILLDANTSDDLNIASIIFRADEAAFMTGIAVSQYLNDNFNEYRGNGGLCIGTFGGLAIPSVTIYMGGIEYGVKVYNDNIEQIANYYQQNPQFANGVD